MMETEELLGSVTTYSENEQNNATNVRPAIRTSARVIKKLRQDVSQAPIGSVVESIDKKDYGKSSDLERTDREPVLVQDKNSSKQRMPKAVWSTVEKNLFFEALNEYGKDFDAITAYICNKMKRKVISNSNMKTKNQVSHFYYRTWHKVSKHIQFDSNVKKVAQELYTLINYGEMRKRLVSGVLSKLATRLPELVKKGVFAVRAKGRTLRVRTPMCRALRKLNNIEEWDEHLKLPSRVCVQIVARDSDAWSKVQCLSHNPRVLAPVAPSCKLGTLLTILSRKWISPDQIIRESLVSGQKKDFFTSIDTQISCLINPSAQCNLTAEFEKIASTNETNVQKQEGIVRKDPFSKKPDDGSIISDNVQRNSFNVNSLNDRDEIITANKTVDANNLYNGVNTNNEQSEVKKQENNETLATKTEDCSMYNIQSGKLAALPKEPILHLGPKPGVTLNLPVININEHVTSQRICLTSYQERLASSSFNNQSDKGGMRFKSQKRQRKDSGDADAPKKSKCEGFSYDKTDVFDIDETANDGMDMTAALAELKTSAMLPSDDKSNDDDGRDKDFFSEDDDKCNNETDGENDRDVTVKISKETSDKLTSARRLKFLSNKDKDQSDLEKNHNNLLDSPEDQNANVNKNTAAAHSNPLISEFFKKNWNHTLLQEQMKKGWNMYDAGDLSIGDLYLMFGSDFKLELNYWWCEATPSSYSPNNNNNNQTTSLLSSPNNERQKLSKDSDSFDLDDIKSPKSTTNDDGDSKKDELDLKEISSPDPKSSIDQDQNAGSTYHLISKLGVNTISNEEFALQKADFPWVVPQREKILKATDRLKKLLSIFQLHSGKSVEGSSCKCCHPCGKGKKIPNKDDGNRVMIANVITLGANNELEKSQTDQDVFRTPFVRGVLVPKEKKVKESANNINFESMPPWTLRGKNQRRPSRTSQVVVKKYLPILPKPNQEISTTPVPAPIVRVLPALRPKPPKIAIKPEKCPTPLAKDEIINIQYDGDVEVVDCNSPSFKNAIGGKDASAKKEVQAILVPSISIVDSESWQSTDQNLSDSSKKIISEASLTNMLDISLPSNLIGEDSILNSLKSVKANLSEKQDNFAGLWPSGESLSMSPSRLLKENEDHWIDTEVNNFSLSSFLGHLEGPTLSGSTKTEQVISSIEEPDNEHNSFAENISAGIL